VSFQEKDVNKRSEVRCGAQAHEHGRDTQGGVRMKITVKRSREQQMRGEDDGTFETQELRAIYMTSYETPTEVQ
jgi:hypothetical protein